jgi:hypothetical protein
MSWMSLFDKNKFVNEKSKLDIHPDSSCKKRLVKGIVIPIINQNSNSFTGSFTFRKESQKQEKEEHPFLMMFPKNATVLRYILHFSTFPKKDQ